LGGGYGGKISRSHQIAAAAAVAAWRLHRPVRVALDLKTGLEMVGKRLPYLAKYRVRNIISTYSFSVYGKRWKASLFN